MKRLLCFCALGLLCAAPVLRAEDAAGTTPLPPASNPAAAAATRQNAEENYNTLKGTVDDLLTAQGDLGKQLQELKRQIEELRVQSSKPNGNFATQDDLKQLAAAIQEIDKKREADKELILKEMEKLGQAVTGQPTHLSPPHGNSTNTGGTGSGTPPVANPDQTGFYYTIKKDDTLGLVAQAYREQGVKVDRQTNPGCQPQSSIPRSSTWA